MSATSNLRLRQSVGIIVQDDLVEFFNSNTRSGTHLKIKYDNIVQLVKNFDGKTSIRQIVKKYHGMHEEQLFALAKFLTEKYVLINQDIPYPQDLSEQHYRLINLLEDYFHSTSEVLKAVENIKTSNVMIVGLGAVGSLIASYLIKSGLENIILIDADNVDISNLHRQYYFEPEINDSKCNALKKQLKTINPNANIEIISDYLNEDFFKKNKFTKKINLIINCSDEPSVDFTSEIIAEYAMEHKIPHIIGGGYNLHLTLIGQTIIPFKTACFKCFSEFLTKINSVELKNIKKLHRENRKLGSFSPLSGIASSLAALDAFKILIGKYEFLQQVNRRIEFNTIQNRFNIIEIPRNKDCEWCKVKNER